jgi:hypothetical protein
MKTKRTHTIVTLAMLGLVALTTAARADVIASTFGPGDSFNTGVGWRVDGPNSDVRTNESLAAMFMPTQNYTLTSFEIAAFHFSGENSYLFSLVADNGGLPTGSAIVSPFASAITTPGANINVFGASGSLMAGNKYWLVMEPGAPTAHAGWNWNSIGQGGFASKNVFTGGNWLTFQGATPTFRVNGRPSGPTNLTPEVPGSVQMGAVLLALGAVALYKRRKQATL